VEGPIENPVARGAASPRTLKATDRSMRLFSGKIAPLSEEIMRALVENKDIECESKKEVTRDIESVFTNYLQLEKEVNERAKGIMTSRGLPPSELGRIRKHAADEKGIKMGEDLLDHLLDQLVEMLMHSNNVDEVFVEDHALRRRMRPALKKYLDVEVELDTLVRGQLKHVQEGSRTWEVEYRRIMEDMQRRKGLV
jgi:uncharacterized protein